MSNKNIRQIIINNLNELLSRENIKAVDFAEAVGVSKSAVSHWLSGDNSPNIEILAKICQKYDVKMSELLNGQTDFSFSEIQHIKKYPVPCHRTQNRAIKKRRIIKSGKRRLRW